MPVRFSIHFPRRPSRTFVLEEGRSYLLGRGESCDLVVDDSRVSRRHLRLAGNPGGWTLTDLDSKNGTAVDGAPLPARSSITLAAAGPEAWVSLGGLLARFERVSEENRRRHAEQVVERMQTSMTLAAAIDPAQELPVLLGQILTSALAMADAERGFVLVTRPEGDLEVAASRGIDERELDAPEFAGSRHAVEKALDRAAPVVVANTHDHETLAGRPSVIARSIRSLVCLPLRVMDRLLGVVYLDSSEPGNRIGELDVEILSALTSHAALALAVARLHRELAGYEGDPEETARLRGIWDRSAPGYRRPASTGVSVEVGSDGSTTRTVIGGRAVIHRSAEREGPE